MEINNLIAIGKERQASDIHIEDGLPICFRVDGKLVQLDEKFSSDTIKSICKKLVGSGNWSAFLEQGSWDLSRVIERTRCRINVFRTARGLGVALRLLMSKPINIRNLNLNPDLMHIIRKPHGLVLFSGSTGSGKSTSMAALIEEINSRQSKHIITLEQPIEYFFSPKKSLVRQREVGRDTPSFSQGLKDSLREDPDVIVVGEMRDQETMRLTINAAETGHLVFATVHSSTAPEAVARMVGSFGANEQDAVKCQLADCLAAVVCQRITFRRDIGIRVPECEILYSNDSVRSIVRSGNISKLKDSIITGASDNMWSWERYRKWLDEKSDWVKFEDFRDYAPEEFNNKVESKIELSNRTPVRQSPQKSSSKKSRKSYDSYDQDHQIVIDDADEDLESILDELK